MDEVRLKKNDSFHHIIFLGHIRLEQSKDHFYEAYVRRNQSHARDDRKRYWVGDAHWTIVL